ncbi:MAG: DUF1353 domain-containing protein, partial [Prosthecobacter sp.]|nr:DUF1353 domain-containing protein [Prosthecobacter sp.]
AKVDGRGVIVGRPCIEWVKPDKFVYDQEKNGTFAFIRPNKEVIQPGSIETDGGSIPRLLWFQEDFSPWTYAPAYVIHDWMYEAHRRGVPAGIAPDGKPLFYTKEQADWVMAEVIKSQMEKPSIYETKKSAEQLRRIYWAVSKFGDTAWNEKAHPVDALLRAPVIGDALINLPLLPALSSLRAQITKVPRKPEQKGTTTPQP